MSDPIDELKQRGWGIEEDHLVQAVLALAARLDAAEKRIEELELATPCPLLKSICEGWEFTVKLDKEEIIERYAGEVKKQPPNLTAGEFNRSE